MYQRTLKVDFPQDLSVIVKAINDRHDIVHRNGKSLAGVMGKWEPSHINELTQAVTIFADAIEAQLRQQKYGKIQAETEVSEV